MNLLKTYIIIIIISSLIIPLAYSFNQPLPDTTTESHILPRPLIIEIPENNPIEVDDWCMSWRVAVEANNVSPWKTIPDECVEYVKEYMIGRMYDSDLQTVSDQAHEFAITFDIQGNDVWIFDIDETLLSNLPYYAQHGYGSEIFDNIQFDKWVLEGVAQGIKPSLKLYKEVQKLGFKIFLLTGRTENKRNITINNLIMAGFENWDRLILRGEEDHGKTAASFKSDKRKEITEEGFRIIGNSGDQWSDLIGSYVSMRSFKLSNPMYFIS